jgi:type IV pilus biogenesis protein CpaD/CtpE
MLGISSNSGFRQFRVLVALVAMMLTLSACSNRSDLEIAQDACEPHMTNGQQPIVHSEAEFNRSMEESDPPVPRSERYDNCMERMGY